MASDSAGKQPEQEFEQAESCLRSARKNLEIDEWETAVNRAYYAVFHAARSALWLKNCYPQTHAGVHRKFSQLYVKEGEFSSKQFSTLDELEDERIRVDYEIPVKYASPNLGGIIVQ